MKLSQPILIIFIYTFFTSFLNANILYQCIIDTLTYNNIFITRQNIDANNDELSNYYYSIVYYHPNIDINVIKIFETSYIVEIENTESIKINNFNYKNSKNILIEIKNPIENLQSFSMKNLKNNNVINYICNATSKPIQINKNLLIKILGE